MKKGTIPSVQILMTLIFASFACTGSFMAVFYRTCGFSSAEMGVLFSSSACIGMLAQPVWGYLADRFFGKKSILFLLLPLAAGTALILSRGRSFPTVLLLVAAHGFFLSGISPLMDAILLDTVELSAGGSGRKPVSYAFLRSFATAGYAFASLGIGFLVERFGISVIFYGLAFLLLAGTPFLAGVRLPRREDVRMPEGKVPPGRILMHPAVLLFLAGVFLVNIAMMGGANYMNELLVAVGGNVTHLGMIWFVTCVVEYGTFFLVNGLIRKFGVLPVYLTGILLFSLKFVVLSMSRSVLPILVAQGVEGIAFTLFIVSGMEFLNRNMKPDERATVIGIYGAVGGFGALTAGLAGGLLLGVMSPFGLYGVFAGLCVAAAGISLLLIRIVGASRT